VAAAALLPQPAVAQRVETVVELDFPAGIAFDSDGAMYVSERAGRIVAVERGSRRVDLVARIPTVTSGETGLLGLAVAPDDSSLYAFATAPDAESNRVYRIPLPDGPPEIVIDGLPASGYHNGGGVAFAPDGTLLVTNGEQHDSDRAQQPGELGGKVYRYTSEGEVPGDNPFGASPAYAIGLRNPFGIAVDPVSGNAFVTENGPDSHDEVNRIEPGGNYGWPLLSGPGDPPNGLEGRYHDPLLDYPGIIVPTGIAFAPPDRARSRYRGDLFFGAFGEGTIHRVRLEAGREQATSDVVMVEVGEPVIALAWGPRGLYFSTPGAIRVVPIAAPPRPTPTESVTPPPATTTPSPSPAGEDRPGGLGALLVVALLGGLAALSVRRLRR
jgi:glucose/arabinose dehydrogenase